MRSETHFASTPFVKKGRIDLQFAGHTELVLNATCSAICIGYFSGLRIDSLWRRLRNKKVLSVTAMESKTKVRALCQKRSSVPTGLGKLLAGHKWPLSHW